MKAKVIKEKDALSVDEAINVKGGLSKTLDDTEEGCSCNCWIGNSNTNNPVRPTVPGNKN